MDNKKVNTRDINNTKDKLKTQLWYKNINKSDSDSKKKEYFNIDVEKLNLKKE